MSHRTTQLGLGFAVAGALALLSGLAAQAQPGEDFQFRRELASGRRFHLANIIGDVQVTGGSGRTVEVTARKRAGRYGRPEDVTIETIELNDGVALCVRYPSSRSGRRSSDDKADKNPCSWEDSGNWSDRGNRNDTQVDFTVRVPAGLKLHLGTVSGDLTAQRLEGEIELRSVSGDVSLEGGRGPRVDLETVSGAVTLLDITSKEVVGHTVSGEVVFRGPIEDAGNYEFNTTSGNINVALPERPNATLQAATFSGGMSSDLPLSQDNSRRRRHRYDATWGNGSAKLYMESLSGHLSIRVK